MKHIVMTAGNKLVIEGELGLELVLVTKDTNWELDQSEDGTIGFKPIYAIETHKFYLSVEQIAGLAKDLAQRYIELKEEKDNDG